MPFDEGLELWRSDLYEPFHGDTVFAGDAGAVEDDESLLMIIA